MSCKNVIELLPWLLNGSLEPEERQAVEEHLETCEACRRELAATREAAALYAAHPEPEALVSFAVGETPPGVSAQVVEAHVAHCPECAHELAMIRDSRARSLGSPAAADEAGGGKVLPGPWTVGRWRALGLAAGLAAAVASMGWLWAALAPDPARERLAAERATLAQELADARRELARLADAAPDEGGGDLAVTRERVAELERQLKATAAELSEAESRIAGLSREVESLGGPAVGRVPAPLYPSPESRPLRSGAEDSKIREISCPEGICIVNLIFSPMQAGADTVYAEVLNADGATVWRGSGPVAPTDTEASLRIRRGDLPAGAVEIRLHRGAADGELLGRFFFQVR